MNIRQEDDYVIINGFKIEGRILEERCQQCRSQKIRDDQYDAYFCATCNKWLEEKCNDSDCHYCSQRPNKPIPEQYRR
ncbi:hypothetical protein MHH70_03455 [Metasolibacillus sp. FSL H7-0170]|uniref:hypothetical protein n=1 Tax=Metasolibacillus TaxID=2703677 RepID=UPI000798F69B|nr:hypothetical protein [Metasolibacillus fluoroglycofenilyticus]KYG92121.1 hypothetical protein A0U40_04045 [[Bacillus] sp. KCTC 13219]